MKLKSIIVLILCSLLLAACATQEERRVKSLQKFTADLQKNSDKYSDEQWQKSIDEYEAITESLQTGRYTDEERREIGKLKGQCLAIYAQYAVGAYQKELEGATNELQGVLEGFFDAYNGDSEE